MTMALTQVTTGGVDENINIDSNTLKVDGTNNRVGIGTASPSESLEISTSANETPAALSLYSRDTSIAGTQEIGAIYGKGLDSGGSGPYVGGKITFAADGTWDTGTNYYYPTAIKFYTQQATGTDNVAAGPRMVIDSSGRLLVGTNSNFGDGSSGDALQVATTTGGHLLLGRNNSFVAANQTIGLIRGYSYGGSAWQETARISIQADDAHASGDKPGRIVLATTADGASSPTERMRINSAGNIGIGTSAPAHGPLHVHSSSTSAYFHLTNSTTGSAASDGFSLFLTGSDAVLNQRESANMRFFTGNSERMRIDGTGNVAIGTTTIGSAPLTLYSSASRTMYQGSSTGTGNGNGFTTGNNGGADAFVWNYENGYMQFATNNSERMRLDASGRLLVGTTSAPDSGSTRSIQLVHTSTAALSLGRNDSTISAGNDIGAIRFWGNAGGSYQQCAEILAEADGTHANNDKPTRLVFATTADSASSPTERMRINSTGAVTKPSNPLIKSNMGYLYGSSGSLTTSPASAILQASAEIDKGDNGWTTSGSNAYTFVCPVDGIYAVHAHTSLGSVTTGRAIWVMAYTAGGGNLPLANYVEVMDTEVTSHENYSYFNTWSFTAGTRVGFGINGGSGAMGNHSSQWGIYLLQ